MNLHLAECPKNIIQRTALWYRLERIGEQFIEQPETIFLEPVRQKVYLSIDSKALELQKRISLLESQVNTLKEKSLHKGKTLLYKDKYIT